MVNKYQFLILDMQLLI